MPTRSARAAWWILLLAWAGRGFAGGVPVAVDYRRYVVEERAGRFEVLDPKSRVVRDEPVAARAVFACLVRQGLVQRFAEELRAGRPRQPTMKVLRQWDGFARLSGGLWTPTLVRPLPLLASRFGGARVAEGPGAPASPAAALRSARAMLEEPVGASKGIVALTYRRGVEARERAAEAARAACETAWPMSYEEAEQFLEDWHTGQLCAIAMETAGYIATGEYEPVHTPSAKAALAELGRRSDRLTAAALLLKAHAILDDEETGLGQYPPHGLFAARLKNLCRRYATTRLDLVLTAGEAALRLAYPSPSPAVAAGPPAPDAPLPPPLPPGEPPLDVDVEDIPIEPEVLREDFFGDGIEWEDNNDDWEEEEEF